jgi:hypothetical protein
MKKEWCALAFAMLAAGAVTAGEDLSNTYIEAGLIEFKDDADEDLDDMDGFRLHGNVNLVGGLYVTADWFQYDYNGGFGDEDFSYRYKGESDWLMPGIGFHLPANGTMQFAAELAYVWVKTEFSTTIEMAGFPTENYSDSDEDDGVAAKLLWRWRPGSLLEFGAEAQRIHINPDDLDTYAVFARLHLTDSFSLGYQYQQWDDSDIHRQNLSARFSF